MQSALFTSPSQESRWLINAAVSNRLLNLQHRGIAPSGLVSSSAAVSNRLLNLQHRGIAPSGLVSSLRRTKTFVSTLLRLHTNLAAHAQSKTINHFATKAQLLAPTIPNQFPFSLAGKAFCSDASAHHQRFTPRQQTRQLRPRPRRQHWKTRLRQILTGLQTRRILPEPVDRTAQFLQHQPRRC